MVQLIESKHKCSYCKKVRNSLNIVNLKNSTKFLLICHDCGFDIMTNNKPEEILLYEYMEG